MNGRSSDGPCYRFEFDDIDKTTEDPGTTVEIGASTTSSNEYPGGSSVSSKYQNHDKSFLGKKVVFQMKQTLNGSSNP